MAHFTIRQLEVFAAVARHASVTAAAREVHLTHPAVSMQLKQLEELWGLALLERRGNGIQLTEFGVEMTTQAEDLLEKVRAMTELAAGWRGERRGKVRLGVVTTAKYFAPALLARFLKSRPGIDFRLSVHNRDQILTELRGNTLDFVIMGRPPDGLDCVATPFAPNPLGILAAPAHPLVMRRHLSLDDLRDEPFIVREHGSGTRAAMERCFAENGSSFKTTMEMTSNETIKQAVMAGLGVTFLSLHTARNELAQGRIVLLSVAGLPLRRQWYLVSGSKRTLAPAVKAFGRFILSEAEEILGVHEADVPQLMRPTGNRRKAK